MSEPKSKFTTERERCKAIRAEQVEELEKDKATHDTEESLRASTADDQADS